MRDARLVGAAVLALLGACDDALDQRLGVIDQPRVLAVIAEPAEARPGEPVRYEAIVASPDGPVAAIPQWSYCTSPKPPTEDNAASAACVAGEATIELGTGATVTGTLPAEGCILFGPDVPPGGFRPRDPDTTGGYYQPVRVVVDELLAIGLSRITCRLPSAPFAVARRYDTEYVPNVNPQLDPIVLDRVPAETEITLTASWSAPAAEHYLAFDPIAQVLVDRREAMRVSWFVTAGTLAVDASAISEHDDATSVSTTWRTPAAGRAWIWLVLRDSRGGIATQARSILIE